MIFRILSFLCIISVSFIIAGCMAIGLNFNNKTPRKAARLPAFTQRDSLKGFNNEWRSCFDVLHYDIHLAMDDKEKSISGFVTTRFSLLRETSKIQLDLDKQMVIDSITQNNRKLSYTRKYTAVFIDLISQNKIQEVTVYYHGKPEYAKDPPWKGGFVWKKDKNGKSFVSVACEGNGAQLWLPVKTYLGDEPDSVSTHFTVPEQYTAVSNGNFVSVSQQGNSKTYSWKTSYPINPYNIAFYMGDYKLIETPYTCLNGEKMTLSYYVLKDNFEKAKTHFQQAGKMIRVYEQLFGTYPWARDGYKLVESPFAGMEHQTAIAYGNGYKNEYNEDYDYIILHETAHEWWGNAVSVADFSDVWIHEGFATYAEALYLEKAKNYDAYLSHIEWNAMTVMNKKPVIGPKGLYYWNYKDGDPYVKGSVMLHTLRNHINNDTLFFSIIKTFYKNFCYKTANTSDFVELVNNMTGKDLRFFFDQYLYRRESPLLCWDYDYNKQTGEYKIAYWFERVAKEFTTPVQMQQGGQTFMVYPTTSVQYIKLPFSSKVPVSINTKSSYMQDRMKLVPLD